MKPTDKSYGWTEATALSIASLVNACCSGGGISYAAIGAGSAATIAGLLTNAMHNRIDRDSTALESLKAALANEHLAKAAANGIKFCILNALPRTDEKLKAAFSSSVSDRWLWLQKECDPRVELYAEQNLAARVTEYLTQSFRGPEISEEVWKIILEEVVVRSEKCSGFHSIDLPHLAGYLAAHFPQQLYNAFKMDLQTEGAAFAGIILRLLANIVEMIREIAASVAQQLRPDFESLSNKFDSAISDLLRNDSALLAKLDESTHASLRHLDKRFDTLEEKDSQRHEELLGELRALNALKELEPGAVASLTFHSIIPDSPMILVGRESVIENALANLRSSQRVVALLGIGGIGKSTIAKEIANRSASEGRFKSVVWVSGGALTDGLVHLYDLILQCAGLQYAIQLQGPVKRTKALSIVSSFPFLIVIDSYDELADPGELNAFIASQTTASRVLITSRAQPAIDSYHILLAGLSPREAILLLDKTVHELDLNIEKSELTHLAAILTSVGNVPLLMKWSIGQLKHGGQTIEGLEHVVGCGEGSIFDQMFRRSWDSLSEDERLALANVAIFPSSLTADAMTAPTRSAAAEPALLVARLTGLALLEPSSSLSRAKRRYDLHPLTRSYVKSRTDASMLKSLHFHSGRFFCDHAEANGGDRWDWISFDIIEPDLPNFITTMDRLFADNAWNEVRRLQKALSLFLSLRGHWKERIRFAEMAITASQAMNDPLTEAWCLVYDLAYIDLKYRQYDAAWEKLQKALSIFATATHELGLATCWRHLGRIMQERKRFDEALDFYQRSHGLYVKLDPEYGAFLLWDIGTLLLDKKELNQAKDSFQAAFNQSEGREGKSQAIYAMTCGSLGDIAMLEDRTDDAIGMYDREYTVAYKIARADTMAAASKRMALYFGRIGDQLKAAQFRNEAIRMYYQLGDQYELQQLLI